MWVVDIASGDVVAVNSAFMLVRRAAIEQVDTGRGRHRGLTANVALLRAMGRFYRKTQGGSNAALDVLVYLARGVKLAVSVTCSAIARRGATH